MKRQFIIGFILIFTVSQYCFSQGSSISLTLDQYDIDQNIVNEEEDFSDQEPSLDQQQPESSSVFYLSKNEEKRIKTKRLAYKSKNSKPGQSSMQKVEKKCKKLRGKEPSVFSKFVTWINKVDQNIEENLW